VPTPVFLDLEVLRHDAPAWVRREVSDFRAPANYKDPEKIAAYVQAKHDEQEGKLRDESSLMPNGPLLGGTICAVAAATGDSAIWVGTAGTGDEAGEIELLRKAAVGLVTKNVAEHILVTYNGDEYDVPFLAKRALRHGLYDLAKWLWSARTIDIRRVWQWRDRSAMGRLTDIAHWLGIEVTDTTRGSLVQQLWEAGQRAEVGAHARSDLYLLREVYYRFAAAGWVPAPDYALPELTPRPLVGTDLLPKPDPLVTPSGVQMPGLPVPESLMAVYHRAVSVGWDPAPFMQADGTLKTWWLDAALLHMATPLREAFERWTGGQKYPGFRSTLEWHDELRQALRAAQVACKTGEVVWVAATPEPAEATTTVITAEGVVFTGRRVDGPDDDRTAMRGELLREPGRAATTQAQQPALQAEPATAAP
jgi:hypothetical protein